MRYQPLVAACVLLASHFLLLSYLAEDPLGAQLCNALSVAMFLGAFKSLSVNLIK